MDTPLIDDDHIISLLRKDAEASRLGSSLTATRRDKNAPKPNTRFLKNLVKNADSHNAALLAKEKAETRARLRGLEGGLKRGREEAGNDRDDGFGKRKKRDGEREGRWKGVLSGLGKPNTRERDGDVRRERRRNSPDARSRPQKLKDEDRSAGKDHKEHSKHRRRRSRSPDSRSRSPQHHHRHSSHRERKSNRSRSPEDRKRPHERKRHSRSPENHHHDNNKTTKNPSNLSRPSTSNHNNKPPTSEPGSDDPLTTFLGPAPPPTIRPRGRGAATSNTSTMDLRFNDPSYNPRADVALSDSEGEAAGRSGSNPKDDPWSTSLETLRDRAAWRIKGAARLREAGFKDADVQKWESGGREKDERDLEWRGEGGGEGVGCWEG
ncbi:hypothetical protein Q7P36_003908 [Cladosporium allicinum]